MKQKLHTTRKMGRVSKTYILWSCMLAYEGRDGPDCADNLQPLLLHNCTVVASGELDNTEHRSDL